MGELLSHGPGPVFIVVVVFLKDIWKKEKFEHKKYYCEFYYHKSPQFLSDSHVAEAIGIQKVYFPEFFFHFSVSDKDKFLIILTNGVKKSSR